MKLNWDTEIPSELVKEWKDLLKILEDSDSIEVNGNIFVNFENDPIVKRELHGFTDASLGAYGAITIQLQCAPFCAPCHNSKK